MLRAEKFNLFLQDISRLNVVWGLGDNIHHSAYLFLQIRGWQFFIDFMNGLMKFRDFFRFISI